MGKRKRDGNTTDGYEVGYGKPPTRHRFKPGQSGNPRGRPKRARTIEEGIMGPLMKPVTVTENGKRRTMTMFEVIVSRLVRSATTGDTRAAALITKFIGLLPRVPEGGLTAPPPDLRRDREALARILGSMGVDLGLDEPSAREPHDGEP